MRFELGLTVSENLSILSMLPGMTVEYFNEKIMNEVMRIIFKEKDKITQGYCLEVFINVFPLELYINSLHTFL